MDRPQFPLLEEGVNQVSGRFLGQRACRIRTGEQALDAAGRDHFERLVDADTPLAAAELAVEVGDRMFEVAFEKDLRGDEWIIRQGIDLVTGYLERFATRVSD